MLTSSIFYFLYFQISAIYARELSLIGEHFCFSVVFFHAEVLN